MSSNAKKIHFSISPGMQCSDRKGTTNLSFLPVEHYVVSVSVVPLIHQVKLSPGLSWNNLFLLSVLECISMAVD